MRAGHLPSTWWEFAFIIGTVVLFVGTLFALLAGVAWVVTLAVGWIVPSTVATLADAVLTGASYVVAGALAFCVGIAVFVWLLVLVTAAWDWWADRREVSEA